MNIGRILRLKEVEEKERARRLREIEEEIARLLEDKERYERELRLCKERILGSKEALRLIFKQKAFVQKIEEINRRLSELEELREKERESLKDIKREEGAVLAYRLLPECGPESSARWRPARRGRGSWRLKRKLEALRKKPLTEEEKEVKKLIEIVSRTPSDEAGAILNEVNNNELEEER